MTANDLERACLATLEELLLAYGEAVARQAGDDEPPIAPRSFTCVSAFDRWAEDQLPAIVVESPGMRAVELHGGTYDGTFTLRVGAYCSASTELATHELVRLWTAAIRTCLLQTPSLGGLVSSMRLLTESYAEMTVPDRRTIVAGTVELEAVVSEIVSVDAGPLAGVDPPDLAPWPSVLTHEETIERLPDPVEDS